jgi:monoterpene epsilon-lactone hydrolase
MPLDIVSVPTTPDLRLAEVVAGLRALPAGRAEDYALTRLTAEAPYVDSPRRLRATGLHVEEVDAGGVPAILVTPPSAHGTLVGVHGGSYVLCSARTHLERFAAVGTAAGWRTLSLDYRRAPEHPYPAALDDVVAALSWARSKEDGPVGVIGDSAGGGLSLAALLRVRDLGRADVDAAVLISPWADLRCSAGSHRDRRDRDPFAHLDDLLGYARLYVGDHPIDDPLLSPVNGNFAGLPPLLVQVGSEETLYDDAMHVAQEAAKAGVAVRLEVWEGMFHTWHAHLGGLVGADDAIAAAGRFLAAHRRERR